MNENIRELGWEDEIIEEGSPFEPLPEGDYEFTVSKVERTRYEGSDRIPACNMAKVTFTIWGADRSADIIENFYLNSKTEWKISAFYLAIGLKKHGEPVKMQWNAVSGRKGKCRLEINKYTDKNGNPARNNRIKKFYAYDEAERIQTLSAPAKYVQDAQPQTNYQPNPYPQNSGGWQSGKF